MEKAAGLEPSLLSRVRWRPWRKNALSPNFSEVSARRSVGVKRKWTRDRLPLSSVSITNC